MPAIACELAWLCERVHSLWCTVLLLDAGDDADLVAELAVGLGNRVDMKTRGVRLHIYLVT
jgi:hypothetical protein